MVILCNLQDTKDHYIIVDFINRVHLSPTLWKWTLSRPLVTKSLLEILQLLVPLTLKILRSEIVGVIALWVISVAIVARQRLPKRPFKPRHRAPTVPERGLHIERSAFIY